MEFSANQLILNEMTVDNGPYMREKFASLIDAHRTDQADKILGEDFRRYLDQYFLGWKLTCAVELSQDGRGVRGRTCRMGHR
jgi:hypothetical protein